MLHFLLGFGLINLIFFALHVTNRGSFPRPLTPQEEQEAILKMEQGDKDAKDKLILHNLLLRLLQSDKQSVHLQILQQVK